MYKKIFIALQYLLPQIWLTQLLAYFTNLRWLKNMRIIGQFAIIKAMSAWLLKLLSKYKIKYVPHATSPHGPSNQLFAAASACLAELLAAWAVGGAPSSTALRLGALPLVNSMEWTLSTS